MSEPTTRTVDVPGARLIYDVHTPETQTSKRPLFIFGSPMGAAGFDTVRARWRRPARLVGAHCARDRHPGRRRVGLARW